MTICIGGLENGVTCIHKFPFRKPVSVKEAANVIFVKERCKWRSGWGRTRYTNEAAPAFDITDKRAQSKYDLGRMSLINQMGAEIQMDNPVKLKDVAHVPVSGKFGTIEMQSNLNQLIEPVAVDLQLLNENLETVVGAQNPVLMSAAKQLFGAGGKRMRPAIVFLVSRATAELAGHEDIKPQHRRLAEITEMIHTASLIHDDVLDESEIRRGKKTIHQIYGTRVAILAGDFMFAQSSWYLANLENLEVIKLISQVIKDFANGEIKQASNLFDCDTSLQDYLDKSFYKTASLIAASARSAAIFSGVSAHICSQMYEYGKNLGLAFQIVDDILDFTQSTEQLGKPAGSDLAKGNLTAPVLFSLEQEPTLRDLIDSEFTDHGSLQTAIAMVLRGGGVEKARLLAKDKGDLAFRSLECLPAGPARSSLAEMISYVLERIF